MTEELTVAVVDLVLAIRSEYLAGGGKALSHWDQLQSRLLVAARSSRDARRFVTRYAQGMRLGAPQADRSAATDGLYRLVGDGPEWLREIPQEVAYIMALARLRADERRESRKARQNQKSMTDQATLFEGEGGEAC